MIEDDFTMQVIYESDRFVAVHMGYTDDHVRTESFELIDKIREVSTFLHGEQSFAFQTYITRWNRHTPHMAMVERTIDGFLQLGYLPLTDH